MKQGQRPQNVKEKKRPEKGRNTNIVIGNTRKIIGSWIFMEKIENNIKDQKFMCCIA
jgi:hypothetical protein